MSGTYDLTDHKFPGLRTLFREGQEAMGWYVDAHHEVLRVAEALRLDPEYVAGCIAVTSPRTSVRRNGTLALALALGGARAVNVTPGRGPSFIAGHKCLTGVAQAAQRWVATRTISKRAPKVRAFAANLGGDLDQCTLDVHAWRAFLQGPDRPLVIEARTWANLTRRRYNIVADVYKRAAKDCGVSVAEFQAAVWHAARLRQGRIGLSNLTLPL